VRRHHIVTAVDPLPGGLRQVFEAVAAVAAWPSITGAEMSNEPISQRAAEHVAAFNNSVRSGDWAAFADRLTSDATMRFAGVPAGPFNGREAIAAGYASQPRTR
jgi:hypothetical protein